jgi:hypothetical protein
VGGRTIVAAVMAGVGAIAAVASCGHDSDESNDALRAWSSIPGDYSYVALPTDAPPEGALVRVTKYSDPEASGQHVAFEYQALTIQACSIRIASASNDACQPQSTAHVFRTIKQEGVVTTYAVSTKAEDLPEDANAPIQFFDSAAVTFKPDWLPQYAQHEYERRYAP